MALQSVQHGKPSLLRLSIQEANIAKNRKKKVEKHYKERRDSSSRTDRVDNIQLSQTVPPLFTSTAGKNKSLF